MKMQTEEDRKHALALLGEVFQHLQKADEIMQLYQRATNDYRGDTNWLYHSIHHAVSAHPRRSHENLRLTDLIDEITNAPLPNADTLPDKEF